MAILDEGKGMEDMIKPRILIRFGMGGHETEYVINYFPQGTAGTCHDIPEDWAEVFSRELLDKAEKKDDWYIADRGTRLEIHPPTVNRKSTGSLIERMGEQKRTPETDLAIKEVLKKIVGEDTVLDFNA